jgi:hypothetical protein
MWNEVSVGLVTSRERTARVASSTPVWAMCGKPT